jgi:hypothetical protein
MQRLAQGWQPDPLRRHEERWISAGEPTDLVRDGAQESHDPPDPSAPLRAIDVDQLQSGKPLPFPWRRPRWQRILVLAAAGCVVVAVLATYFGHALVPAKPLGPNEAIGTALFVESSSHYVLASYAPQGSPGVQGMASGYIGAVAPGQPVVVRFEPNQPASGTVLSQPVPKSSPNGIYGVFIGVLGVVGFGTIWLASIYRKWRFSRAREADTDYRAGPWAGTTSSA